MTSNSAGRGKPWDMKPQFNAAGFDGQPKRCDVCGSMYHLKAECPRKGQGKGKGKGTDPEKEAKGSRGLSLPLVSSTRREINEDATSFFTSPPDRRSSTPDALSPFAGPPGWTAHTRTMGEHRCRSTRGPKDTRSSSAMEVSTTRAEKSHSTPGLDAMTCHLMWRSWKGSFHSFYQMRRSPRWKANMTASSGLRTCSGTQTFVFARRPADTS